MMTGERYKKEQAEIHRKHVKDRDALHEIRHGKRKDEPALQDGSRRVALPPEERPEENKKDGEIAQKAERSGLRKVIEEYAVRAVKPRLGILPGDEEAGIKKFIVYG